MIDTHSHILPGLDDGPDAISQSLGVIRTAETQGITTLLATPHSLDGIYNCTKNQILDACKQLNRELWERNISVSVLPGSEIRVDGTLMEKIDNNEILTLNNAGRYILLELPPIFMVEGISFMLRQLRDRGVVPVLAHSERYPMILSNPAILSEFLYNGARLQISAGSLTGDFGKPVMKFVYKMLAEDMVYCVGSDIHPGRKYRMADAEKRIKKFSGQKKSEIILIENPHTIVHEKEGLFHNRYVKKHCE